MINNNCTFFCFAANEISEMFEAKIVTVNKLIKFLLLSPFDKLI
jgi:hypothetical protein